jgi:nitric oxide reductase NorQ protein
MMITKTAATKPVAPPAAATPLHDVLHIEPSPAFVATKEVASIVERALLYLRAGYPVHFAGPPGVGKTSLAFHTAALLGTPAVLLHGDDEFQTSDLTGREGGHRTTRVVDNFIHSVTKVKEEHRAVWVNSRLTVACQNGYTLIYDEFNRSRPETNNTLLSVLSEGVLNLPRQRQGGRGYVEVHPGFRAIFTSNPEEYAGVHKAQDALLDRIITLFLDPYDRDTEIAIVESRASLSREASAILVDIVRALRKRAANGARPTLRAAIAIGRVVQTGRASVHLEDEAFRWACRDILSRDITREMPREIIDATVTEVCTAHGVHQR